MPLEFSVAPALRKRNRSSMDFRFGDALSAFEEIEVAAFVGLACVLREYSVIAARVITRRRLVGLAPLGNLFVAQMHMDRALRYIHCDRIAVPSGGEWTADLRFRRHMQDARTIARTAHPRIG